MYRIVSPHPARHRFSLIEIMVVLLILGLVLAVVMPRIGATPLGLRVASTFSTLRNACAAASTQARATGQPVRLYFDFGNNELRPEPEGESSAFDQQPASAVELEKPVGSLFRGTQLYRLDPTVLLNLEEIDPPLDARELSFVFYPSGEATGPRLPITIGRRWFTIDVDRLTGKPIIREQE